MPIFRLYFYGARRIPSSSRGGGDGRRRVFRYYGHASGAL